MESALYLGNLRHRRFAPKRHEFRYPVFMAFLDIDRLAELMQVSRFASYNRWNWTGFDERDHFGEPGTPLRERLRSDASREGLTLPGGRIFLLSHLRYLGYVFNPVSFFYCYDERGCLAMILGEVNNTFGESHNYWLGPANQQGVPRAPGSLVRYRTAKRMHVSPFHGMEMDYDWMFSEPGERLAVHMNTVTGGTRNFDATLTLDRRPWESQELRKTLLGYPLLTVKVIAAIHWQALRLWGKGLPVFRHRPKQASGPAATAQKEKVTV